MYPIIQHNIWVDLEIAVSSDVFDYCEFYRTINCRDLRMFKHCRH